MPRFLNSDEARRLGRLNCPRVSTDSHWIRAKHMRKSSSCNHRWTQIQINS